VIQRDTGDTKVGRETRGFIGGSCVKLLKAALPIFVMMIIDYLLRYLFSIYNIMLL